MRAFLLLLLLLLFNFFAEVAMRKWIYI